MKRLAEKIFLFGLTGLIFLLPIHQTMALGGLNMGAFFQNPAQPIYTQQLGAGPNATSAILNRIASTTDTSGNTIVAVSTSGNFASCAGVSANCLGSATGSLDYAISKYNSSGTWIWTQQLGEIGHSANVGTVATDTSGNIYVAGYTDGNLVSCGGVSANCSGAGQSTQDYFVSKYSSTGVWQWTSQLGETSMFAVVDKLGIDGSGNVFAMGYTSGSLVSCNGVSANCSGTSTGASDYFVSKYNSSGVWQSTFQMGEAGKVINAYAAYFDASGNMYFGGSTTGNLPSCTGVSANCSGSSQGTTDYFVSKYSSLGAWQWTKQLGETSAVSIAEGITVDASNNVIVSGITSGNLVSCAGVSASCSGTSQGTNDYFISKYDSTGAWQWTTQLGETGKNTTATGVVADSSGNITVAGTTPGNLVSCAGVSTNCSGVSNGAQDFYFSKYNSSGVWQSTQQLGETSKTMNLAGPTSDASGNIFITGYSSGNIVSCGGVSANCAGNSQGTKDYFVSKYNSSNTWQWTQQLGEGGGKTSSANGIATDTNGNTFVFGSTTGNLASCGGISSGCAGSSQGSTDYFVSKYNSVGTWQWTRQLGQTGKAVNVANSGAAGVDSSGNVYVGGTTTGNLASCGGVSANCSGSSQGSLDYFVSKYDASGTWLWTQQMGETGKTFNSAGVTANANGSVWVFGTTTGNLPSCSGVSANCSGSSQGSQDYFISKYNTSGAWQWTKQLGETGATAVSFGLAADSSGNSVIVGYTFGNLASCGGVSTSCVGVSQGTFDYFVSKYDASGSWQWTQQMGESAKQASAYGVAIDSNGNIVVAGYTSANLPSCSGLSANCSGSSQGTFDTFVSKYNSSGAWQWTQQLGQTGVSSSAIATAVDASGNVIVAGSSGGNLFSCKGVSANCSGSPQGTGDYFVSKYSSAGVWQWTRQVGETNKTSSLSTIAVDAGGNVIGAGQTNGKLSSCNGNSATCTSGASNGIQDYFVVKYRHW
jgi:hypothetical protein